MEFSSLSMRISRKWKLDRNQIRIVAITSEAWMIIVVKIGMSLLV